MVWTNPISENKTAVQLKEIDCSYNSLVIELTISSLETAWICHIFDNKTTVPLGNVDRSCNNLLVDPTVFFWK